MRLILPDCLLQPTRVIAGFVNLIPERGSHDSSGYPRGVLAKPLRLDRIQS